MVEATADSAAALGMICLEIAPAYMSEAEASPILALYAEEIGLRLDDVLARRRYAITGDRRCLKRLGLRP
ncbi:hypothetical protein [Sphaerisporangium fuscum]|uniref:hypothetical protein n=1 Tax=Sphaerisporangium fuscum TaxID=2835868 RepID=UPI001BDC4C56|nr:hypothetical protein [Sphaerisporangium fuscum]